MRQKAVITITGDSDHNDVKVTTVFSPPIDDATENNAAAGAALRMIRLLAESGKVESVKVEKA